MQTLYDGVLTDDLVQLSLPRVIDRILDPLVHYHQTHPAFLALWLKSQDDPRLSAMGQDLDEALAQKTAWILTRRYPQSDEASALRCSRICMQTVQALTALAFKGPQVDYTVITELKTMIHSYLREVFRPQGGKAGK
jgi:Tetracyclin repressor-like, C-terminal domain